jgi:enoyl-CoA hydratase
MASSSAVEMMAADTIGLYDRIAAHAKPLIAAVSGWALGGGAELAMICDMIIASETAKFGQPEVTIGVIPGAGGTQRLTRAVGKALAMEMVINNRHLSADEAARLGLVNHVYPVDTYLDEALRIAREIAARAPLAVRLAKEAIDRAFEGPLSDGIAHERRSFYFLFATDDQKEGMAAFSEKRSPAWKGR